MIGAIVLAAERSRRMGAQKLLLPLGGQPIIARIVDSVLKSSVGEVCVVVGSDAEAIKSVLAGRKVQFVFNPDPQADMLRSVRCGLRVLPEDCEAVLVVLGDQPGVTSDLIDALIQKFRAGQHAIIVPRCRERRGHPLLFAARFRDEVLTHHESVGLQGLLAAHPQQVGEIEVASAEMLVDMDTPEDYERWQKAAAD